MTNKISSKDDMIDVRDVIARVEELREERESAETVGEWEASTECGELAQLEELLSDLEGMGGDEQWEGVWYPVTLIRDSYFEDYAQELADDIGAVPDNATWPNNCIDWERAARELQQDYTSVEFDGDTYWTR
jgi:antirestriction protein